MKQKKKKIKAGQTFIEYTLLISIVAAIMVAMTPFMRRTIQGVVRLAGDHVGNQIEAEQPGGTRLGFLIQSTATTQVDKVLSTQNVPEPSTPLNPAISGQTTLRYDDGIGISTLSETNQGFVEAPFEGLRPTAVP